MINKPFFSLGSPVLKYPVIQKDEKDEIREIPLPESITLNLAIPYFHIDDQVLKPGDRVITGQRVNLTEDGERYFFSTVTGTITSISEYIGYLGLSSISISIRTTGEDKSDDKFKAIKGTVSPENAVEFLAHVPGEPRFTSLINPETPLNTIVVNGVDKDLLITANQFILRTETEELKKGIEYLKEITNVPQIVIVVSPDLVSDAEKAGAPVKVINPLYPGMLPEIIMKDVFKMTVPAGKGCMDLGVGFINAEAVVALAGAFDRGVMPVNKIVTVINKDGTAVNVKARIGTPVKDILGILNIETRHGDRLVLGGPMTGRSIYSEDSPVLWDTDAIMIQDREQVTFSSDTPCINCGECVRACPANIPVNMLVRLLENGLYEEAVQEYDLLSCIECGLCAYVCVARIPVFHFIMLGKHEFNRLKSMEESHA